MTCVLFSQLISEAIRIYAAWNTLLMTSIQVPHCKTRDSSRNTCLISRDTFQAIQQQCVIDIHFNRQSSTSMLTHCWGFNTVEQHQWGYSHHCCFIDITLICLGVNGPYFAMSWPVYRGRKKAEPENWSYGSDSAELEFALWPGSKE